MNTQNYKKQIKQFFQNTNFIIDVILFTAVLSAFYGKFEYSIPLIGMILPFYTLDLELKKKKQEFTLNNQLCSVQKYYSDVMEVYKLIVHLHTRLEYIFEKKDFSQETYEEIKKFIRNIKKARNEKGVVLISENLFIPGEIKVIAALFINEIDIYIDFMQKGIIENYDNISEKRLKKEEDIYQKIFNFKNDIFDFLCEILGIDQIDFEKLKGKLRKYE